MLELIAPTNAKAKAPDQDNLDLIALQLDRWNRAAEAQRSWATVAKLCQDFLEGRQWSPDDAKKLEESGRYPLTLNRIAPLYRLLKGYLRMNRTQARYRPSSDGVSNQAGADAIGAVSKQLDEMNGAEWQDAEVFHDGIVTGRGYFDLRLKWQNNAFGEVGQQVLDNFAVYPDPEANTYDPGESWSFVQISHWLSWNGIVEAFGPTAGNLVDARGARAGRMFGTIVAGASWDEEVTPERFFGLYEYLGDRNDFMTIGRLVPGSPYEHVDRHRKLIRVIECQHTMPAKVRQFVDLQTGLKKTIPDHWDNSRIQEVVAFMASRGFPLAVAPGIVKKVRHTFTAADVLLYDDWLPYDSMTIVPYFPYFRRGKTMGMVEDLLDPQREVNKRRSVYLHIVMTTANSGWKYKKDTISDETKEMLENEGSKPGILIEHNDDKGPQRIDPAVAPLALERLEKNAAQDIKEISGINDSALGNVDRVQSGRAILARQRQSVVGADDYFANFSRTREMRERKKMELVQNFYTEQRMVRYVDDSGDQQDTMINHRKGADLIVNDITTGKYLVSIDDAPLSSTFAGQEFDDMMEMVKAGVLIPPDEIVMTSNLPKKERIAMRMRGQMPGAPGGPEAPGQPAAPPGPGLPIGAAPPGAGPGSLPHVPPPGKV